jgi:hypothetical protein
MIGRFTLIASLLLTTGAMAAEPTRAGGFADITSRGLYDANLTAPLGAQVGAITIGAMTVALEQTSLEDIAKTLGGPINNEGEAGEHMVWTCYGAGDRTMWFMSDGEMGDGLLTIFALEARAPSVDWNCGTLPANVVIDAGVPALGAASAEVRSKVGPAAADAHGRFSYNGLAPVKTDLGFDIYQGVVYEEHDGLVTAFGVEQLSES